LRTLLIVISLSICAAANAQLKRKIKKSRRYQSESQFALQKSDLQFEWEVGQEMIDANVHTVVYPNLQVHYAMSDRLEVNVEGDLITTTDKSIKPVKRITGMEPALIGVNYQLVEDSGYRPSVILSAQLAFPFLSTKAYRSNYAAPVVQVNVQQAINKQWQVGFGGGAFWDGFVSSPSFIYNASTSYTSPSRWMASLELFGFINGDAPKHSVDVNVGYVFNERVQVAMTAGTGLSKAASRIYLSVNGSWSIGTLRHRHGHD
jgi:Putative MetA-pathway of phenol degradation